MKFKSSVFIFSLSLLIGCVTNIPTKDIERAKIEGIPLVISSIYSKFPNSAGGVDVSARFFNTSDETIKYIVLTVMPYNSVGDIAPSEIGRKKSARLQYTGPLKANDENTWSTWENIWYNHSIRCIEITDVEITYMNGMEQNFSGTEVKKVLSNAIINSCKTH